MQSLSPEARSRLLADIRADQVARWRRGEPRRVEDYLAEHPELAGAEATLELIRGEVQCRQERGEWPALQEYLDRFPSHAQALRRLGPSPLDSTRPESAGRNTEETTAPTEPLASPRQASPAPVLPGFELGEKLGEGGMGVVYRALDVRLGQPRAIKLIHTAFQSGPARERFYREARAVARLDHPGVVRIFSFGEADAGLYLCMELLPGGSLQARLRQGPMEVRAAAELGRRLAEAVQHAHDNHVLHRDLKPANVLLTADGSPKVADFGLAKLLDENDELTGTGDVMGTPAYMAPEQAEGRLSEVNERTDVWALGVILYECLTGQAPFRGGGRLATLELVKRRAPAPPRQLRAEIPAELEAVCLRCLHKRPSQRYAGAADLAADLGRWLDGQPVTTRPRRRQLWAAALLPLLLCGALFLLPRGRHEGPEQGALDSGDVRPSPGAWHPLLTREPEALRWPAGGRNNRKLYQQETRELVLSCEELGLLALGEADARSYQVQLTLQQSPWVGNIGLFLGYREKAGGDTAYQVLELVALSQGEGGQRMRVDWKTASHTGPPGAEHHSTGTVAVSAPFALAPTEHRLGVQVGPGGLAAVSLDGKVLPGLSAATVSRPPADYRGKFGVYVDTGNGVIHSARYLFEESPHGKVR